MRGRPRAGHRARQGCGRRCRSAQSAARRDMTAMPEVREPGRTRACGKPMSAAGEPVVHGDRRSQARRSRHRARFCQPRVGGRRPLSQLRSGRARVGRTDPCGRRPRGRAPCRSGPRGPGRTARAHGYRRAGAAPLPGQQRLDIRARRRARCHAGIVGPAPGEQSARPVRADPAFRPTAGAGGRGQRHQHHRRARLEPDPPFPLVHAQQGRAVDTDPNAGAGARADDPHQCDRAGSHPAERPSVGGELRSPVRHVALAARHFARRDLPVRSTSSWRRPR